MYGYYHIIDFTMVVMQNTWSGQLTNEIRSTCHMFTATTLIFGIIRIHHCKHIMHPMVKTNAIITKYNYRDMT